MDYSKLPRPSLGMLIGAVVLGIIAAFSLYQAQIRGLIPTLGTLPKSPSLEIRTVVQEENTIISAIEKASLSIVAIGLSGEKSENKVFGTGFIINSKGLIITNKHTVSPPGSYIVVTKDGQRYEAKKIYKDPNLDLGLVQVDATGLKALELADSSKLKLGQTVIAIGNVSGQSTNIVSVGVISSLDQNNPGGLIQTDALISADNSGWPLLSSAGQVIGVNVAGAVAQTFGSAIPSNTVKQFIDDSVAGAAAIKPYLGLRYKFVSKDLAAINSTPQGGVIQEVIKGGPADTAGVKSADVIIAINGQAIDTENKVTDIVSKSNIGQQLELTIWRSGKELKLTLVVVQSPG